MKLSAKSLATVSLVLMSSSAFANGGGHGGPTMSKPPTVNLTSQKPIVGLLDHVARDFKNDHRDGNGGHESRGDASKDHHKTKVVTKDTAVQIVSTPTTPVAINLTQPLSPTVMTMPQTTAPMTMPKQVQPMTPPITSQTIPVMLQDGEVLQLTQAQALAYKETQAEVNAQAVAQAEAVLQNSLANIANPLGWIAGVIAQNPGDF